MTSDLVCPKCGRTDYFLSERNVVKGIGGIYGNRGGTKKFPVCRTCDEIMAKSAESLQKQGRIATKVLVVCLLLLAVMVVLNLQGY
jgi:predicted nucleic acid-binding Zn ribbon protein